MSCFCEQDQEDRCCAFCDEPCSQVCHSVKYGDDCHNPTFRRLERERDDEM